MALRRLAYTACCVASAAAYSAHGSIGRGGTPRMTIVTSTATSAARGDAFKLLAGVEALRVDTGEAVRINEQWSEDERCALFFFRSFG